MACIKFRFVSSPLLDHLRPGDTLVVVRLDRLGRSLRELLDVVEDLQKREVALLSLEEKLDTSSAAGELSCLPVPSRPVRAALHR